MESLAQHSQEIITQAAPLVSFSSIGVAVLNGLFSKSSAYVLQKASDSISEYRLKKIIKDLDNIEYNKVVVKLYDILREEIPDIDKMQVIHSIFISGVSLSAGVNDELLACEYLEVAKKLTPSEIIIMKSTWELQSMSTQKLQDFYLKNNNVNPTQHVGLSGTNWYDVVACYSGFGHKPDIVRKYWENLRSLGLVDNMFDVSSISINMGKLETKFITLTSTGFGFCEFAFKYPIIGDSSAE